MRFYKALFLLTFYFYFTKSESSGSYSGDFREALSLIKECGNSAITICLKEKIIKMIERLPREFELSAGITIKENAKTKKRLFRNLDEADLSTNKSESAEFINEVLLEKISEFVNNHLIEIKVPDETITEYKASFQEGRKKKKKSIFPYILLFKAKAIAMGAFFVKFISLMALKALVIAKIALALTVGIGLKRLSDYSSRHPSTLFEFHQPPPYDNNYWRRLVREDVPYMNQIRNIPYSTISSHEN